MNSKISLLIIMLTIVASGNSFGAFPVKRTVSSTSLVSGTEKTVTGTKTNSDNIGHLGSSYLKEHILHKKTIPTSISNYFDYPEENGVWGTLSLVFGIISVPLPIFIPIQVLFGGSPLVLLYIPLFALFAGIMGGVKHQRHFLAGIILGGIMAAVILILGIMFHV